MAKVNPFIKKATPSVTEAVETQQPQKAALEEDMLREIQKKDNKSKIHRTTLEIPGDLYAQIEEIRSETELSLKGFFMVAAKKYIADYFSKK
jgi:hypothetical protein